MANNPTVYDLGGTAATNPLCALLNGGTLKIYTGSQPAVNAAVTGTLLVTLTFGNPAFGNASAAGGVVTATANSITSGTAGNTGTAGYFALSSTAPSVVATGTCGTSGADLNLNTLSITSGNAVSCSSFLVTLAET